MQVLHFCDLKKKDVLRKVGIVCFRITMAVIQIYKLLGFKLHAMLADIHTLLTASLYLGTSP